MAQANLSQVYVIGLVWRAFLCSLGCLGLVVCAERVSSATKGLGWMWRKRGSTSNDVLKVMHFKVVGLAFNSAAQGNTSAHIAPHMVMQVVQAKDPITCTA